MAGFREGGDPDSIVCESGLEDFCAGTTFLGLGTRLQLLVENLHLKQQSSNGDRFSRPHFDGCETRERWKLAACHNCNRSIIGQRRNNLLSSASDDPPCYIVELPKIHQGSAESADLAPLGPMLRPQTSTSEA